jgi:hypothetical protein
VPNDVSTLLELVLDIARVDRDQKLLDGTGRLVLVQEQYTLSAGCQGVEGPLLDVAPEGPLDIPPGRFVVRPATRLSLYVNALGVSTDKVWCVIPERPFPDRLDLDKGVVLQRDLSPKV